MARISFEKFPSPFGVRVLKSLGRTRETDAQSDGVSVPFRGSCSEMITSMTTTSLSPGRFRPLSGFVF